MKQLNIAVCFSGQTRTWKSGLPSLRRYFGPSHNYVFFGHTWAQNSWKTFDNGQYLGYIEEKLSAEELSNQLREQVKFGGLLVQPQVRLTREMADQHPWLPMLKSAALANNLKTQYEIEHNTRFDLVIKTRWDVSYNPKFSFENFIPDLISPTTLYCWYTSEFKQEFRMPSIDDIMYFGSTRTMNIIDSLYHYYHTRRFFELTKTNTYNPAMDKVGAGVLLYRWACLKNITMTIPKNFSTPPVVRKTSESLLWPEQFEKIHQAYVHFGDPI